MVGLLGVLAAGAAQGYGEAKNREVDVHNAVAMENMREQMRQQFELHKFSMQRQANREDAAMAAEYENNKYTRNRADNLEDQESQREFEVKKLGLLHNNQKSLEGMREAGRNKRALLRRDMDNNNGGVFSQKELAKQANANQKRIFDLKKELAGDMMAQNNENTKSMYLDEIDRLVYENAQIYRQLNGSSGGAMNSSALTDHINTVGHEYELGSVANASSNDINSSRQLSIQAEPARTHRSINEFEALITNTPVNDTTGRRQHLESIRQSLKPKIDRIRQLEGELRRLPYNTHREAIERLTAERNRLEQEVESVINERT